MKLRTGKELSELLRRAREWCGAGAGEVLRKARRKAARLRPDLDGIELESTYGGSVVTVEAQPGESADDLRLLLLWFLRGSVMRPPARFVTPLREGRDYTVVTGE